MLQEAHVLTQDREDRWQQARKKRCQTCVFEMTAISFLGAVAVSAILCIVSSSRDRDFQLSTALTILVLGVISGLIAGRAYWVVERERLQTSEFPIIDRNEFFRRRSAAGATKQSDGERSVESADELKS